MGPIRSFFNCPHWETFVQKISETKKVKTSDEFVNSQENISMSKTYNCSRAGLNDARRISMPILDFYGMNYDFWCSGTGEYLSEAVILASTNPQYDASTWKFQAQNMLCT